MCTSDADCDNNSNMKVLCDKAGGIISAGMYYCEVLTCTDTPDVCKGNLNGKTRCLDNKCTSQISDCTADAKACAANTNGKIICENKVCVASTCSDDKTVCTGNSNGKT